jgi:hypothetical protein
MWPQLGKTHGAPPSWDSAHNKLITKGEFDFTRQVPLATLNCDYAGIRKLFRGRPS